MERRATYPGPHKQHYRSPATPLNKQAPERARNMHPGPDHRPGPCKLKPGHWSLVLRWRQGIDTALVKLTAAVWHCRVHRPETRDQSEPSLAWSMAFRKHFQQTAQFWRGVSHFSESTQDIWIAGSGHGVKTMPRRTISIFPTPQLAGSLMGGHSDRMVAFQSTAIGPRTID